MKDFLFLAGFALIIFSSFAGLGLYVYLSNKNSDKDECEED